MSLDLTNPIFHDEDKAREWLEGVRWPQGPFCPFCGSFSATRMEGDAHRPGLMNCRDCRKQFSVTVGTVFERSHVPLHKWVLANFLMNASKKGISAHQLHRTIKVTYKTAWFMCHRLREAMRDPNPSPLGGEGKIVAKFKESLLDLSDIISDFSSEIQNSNAATALTLPPSGSPLVRSQGQKAHAQDQARAAKKARKDQNTARSLAAEARKRRGE